MHLLEFTQKYQKVIEGELRSAPAIAYRSQRINDKLGDVLLSDIHQETIADYAQWLKSLGLSNGSVNLEIATLSAAFGYAQRRWGWNIPNPCKGQLLRADSQRVRFLTDYEFQKISEGTTRSKHLHDFIVIALNTGMRKNEILKLRWRRVNLDSRHILLDASDTKTARQRLIPLNEKARGVLISRREFLKRNKIETPWVFCKADGERLTKVDGAFKLLVQRAGVHDFRIHDLRHTFASWLVMADVPLLQIKELLGHTTIKTTERYAHLAQSALIKAVSILDTLHQNR